MVKIDVLTEENYFEMMLDIATHFKAIGHNPDDINKTRYYDNPDAVPIKQMPANEWVLITMAPEYGYTDNSSDNILENPHIAFMLLKTCAKEDYAAEKKLRGEAKALAKKIVARINTVKNTKNMKALHIDFNRMSINATGWLENTQGVLCSLVLKAPSGIAYDKNDWSDEA